MIGPDRLQRVTALAVVPEQVLPYVQSVSRATAEMFGDCVGYETGNELVLVGYPLDDPNDAHAVAQSVDIALQAGRFARITLLSATPARQVPPDTAGVQDIYHAVPVPCPPPKQKLRNLLRSAGKKIRLEPGRETTGEHHDLIQRFIRERDLDQGTRYIFERLPEYVRASPTSLVLSARDARDRLAGFVVGEYASLSTAFYMFAFRDTELAPPGCMDLALSGLLEEAHKRGQIRMNLGLGINPGIGFFKGKWGAVPFLTYSEVAWAPCSKGWLERLRSMFRLLYPLRTPSK